ncbi:probable flavin-containing monooxygenase 1 isoform X1 [Humulus lupulus]|uniref:probable flavin-containing monooxygenase 1 isoform X1 n=1 Tax=Humulus lupulus TaxID=3486 RepID=UPI002B408400|nr:probable flavin-containing monooxygenase 1 isoform X1 [Humulus lupulus]
MAERKIAIIGAGISGLLACKHCLEKKGLDPVVFEAQSNIGGVWSKTIESTKLQTPRPFYQFSDFAWPPSVKATFPDHNQVLDYLHSYASHFKIFHKINFNTKVIDISYSYSESIWDFWGGSGEPFSPGKWNVTVQDSRNPSAPIEVYQVDFVIVCIGSFSGFPNIPDFGVDRGPEVFGGVVMHSMDYAAMDDEAAAELIRGKLVTVVGFQKSALDLAAQVARINGPEYPCTLLFRTVHWTVPDYFTAYTFKCLNRFVELMVHKPTEGFFQWLFALLLSPLLWLYSKAVESFLRFLYPLKKYNMVPSHGFTQQIFSCMSAITPLNFYDKVREGSLILKKFNTSFSFCKVGLVIDKEESTPLASDIVIFATGYKPDEKLKNIFASLHYQKCIIGSSAPFYRECIHPRIPNLAILGYSDSPANLYSTEIKSKWVAEFLAGTFKLPSVKDMEEDVIRWEKCMKRYSGSSYKRYCSSALLQIYTNDQLCKDIGRNPRRKNWFLADLFSPYGPTDYKNLTCSV